MRPTRVFRTSSATVVKALEGHYSAVSASRQAQNISEISALLALAPKSWIQQSSSHAGRVSAAAIVAATSFLPSTVRETVSDSKVAPASKLHSATCPFHHAHVPLHALYKVDAFTASPCEACLAKRLNFLASEDLSIDLSHRSIRFPSRGASSTDVPSPVVESIIQASFGSVSAFKAAIKEYLSSRRGSGYTWVAWKDGGSGEGTLMVINMPRNVSPSTIGLWPVAAFDVTDGAIGAVHVAAEGESPSVDHPAWSRAARNPAAAATRRPLAADAATAIPSELSTAVEAVSEFYVSHIDWKTLESQLVAAQSYYHSEQRAQKRKEHRQELEAEATKRTLRTAEEEAEAVAAASVATPATEASTKVQASQQPAAAASAKAGPSAEVAAPVQDPQLTMSEDGVQTFTYLDGRRTVVNPNAKTTTFYTAEHTATSFEDGTTHFLFTNGAEVWTDKTGQSYAKDPRH